MKNLPFEITHLDKDLLLHSHFESIEPNKPKQLNGITALLLCTQGNMQGELDGRNICLKAREAFLLIPSFYGMMRNVSDDFQAIVVVFDYEYYLQYIDRLIDISIQIQFVDMPSVELSDTQYSRINNALNALQMLIKEEQQTDYNQMADSTRETRRKIHRENILNVANILGLYIVDIILSTVPIHPPLHGKKEEIVKQFLTLMYENYIDHRDISFYANRLYVTPRYLSSIVKNKTGRAPSDWIEQRVVTHAKQLLGYSDLSIKQIAARLHFANQSFFGKYFRQRTGMSPKEYRNFCTSN